MNKILEHIENRVKDLSIARLRAKIDNAKEWKAFLEGQIAVYNELYMMLWEQQLKKQQK